MAPAVLRRKEAAEYLACSVAWLTHLAASGELAYLTVGPSQKHRRYRRVDLDSFLARRVVPATADRECKVTTAPFLTTRTTVGDRVLIDVFTGRPLGQSSTGGAASDGKTRRRG